MNTSEYPGRAEKKPCHRLVNTLRHGDDAPGVRVDAVQEQPGHEARGGRWTPVDRRRSKPGPVTASASSVGKQRPVNGLPGVFDSNALSGLYRPERRPRCARCTTSAGSYQQRYGLATVGGLVRVANGSQVGHWRGAGDVAEFQGDGVGRWAARRSARTRLRSGRRGCRAKRAPSKDHRLADVQVGRWMTEAAAV